MVGAAAEATVTLTGTGTADPFAGVTKTIPEYVPAERFPATETDSVEGVFPDAGDTDNQVALLLSVNATFVPEAVES